MKQTKAAAKKRADENKDFDFALALDGVKALTREVEDALFEAGCDDATLTWVYGRLWMEFTRTAASLGDAILSAIRDVRRADIGADVLQVDECNMVTQAEIARRAGRSRQYVHQLITGKRGPGNFPPPHCHLTEKVELWAWGEVSPWLYENSVIKQSTHEEFETIEAINEALRVGRAEASVSPLVEKYGKALSKTKSTDAESKS